MAFERLTVPFSVARVLCDEGGLLVVDKPHGIPVHGGDESLKGDLVTRLADFRTARGEDRYVGVHQRLDEGTSGVMLLTTARERNAEVARAAEGHELERRYVAVVTFRRGRLAERLARGPVRLEHRLLVEGGRSRVVEKGGVLASSEARLLERHGSRALLELRPETGRTHQLRVQLAHEGAPIGGDTDYGGEPAPRLLLHARELTLGTLHVAAPVPPGFERFVRGGAPELGDAATLARAVEDAGILRAPLASHSDAYRLANDLGDDLPGVTIDRYGDHAVLMTSTDEAEQRAGELAGGRRVLNLFSYTSSFGVAAAVAGASEVVSVDVAAPALATARDNFEANGVDPAAHRFLKDDALDFLSRAGRRGERFDLVVLDPPSFASSAAGAPFAVAKHYGRAAELALAVLAPGGRLLAVTNHRKTSSGRLRRLLRDAAERSRVPVAQLKDLPSQLDCPDGPDGPVPSKSVLLTRR
jgi:predicted methyltransferase/16S rRNA U516 pseudouridylate synthase RsuA-like enzyme